ncbi:hypothetical protein, partial [Dietzia sp. UBA5065]|uniref:hypothetical protein n=1 Tax=Dietzia sp. UBA5065 TaxID=1946422 RepID=UPI0025BF2D75
MNPQQPDHVLRTLADLDARLGRITAEVAEVRAGLSAVARQMRSPEGAPVWRAGAPQVGVPGPPPG